MKTTIPTRPLGRTGIEVTELGFGSAPLGGFRGAVGDAAATSTLACAWQGGVRYFDTAPFYGYGRAELRIGALLRELPRASYVLSTKVGRVTRPCRGSVFAPHHRPGGLPFTSDFDYGYDGTMRSIEQSMLRTGITSFDIVLVHDLDTFIHEDSRQLGAHYGKAIDGGFRALAELKQAGIVRAIGVGLNEAPTCARLMRDADLDCVLLAGRYTLLDQTACDEVIPLCASRDIALIAGGPFNSGILAGTPQKDAPFHYRAAPIEVVDRAQKLHALAREHGTTLHAAALHFALTARVVAAVVPGARSPAEEISILDSYRTTVPQAFWQSAIKQGYIRADSPIEPNAPVPAESAP